LPWLQLESSRETERGRNKSSRLQTFKHLICPRKKEDERSPIASLLLGTVDYYHHHPQYLGRLSRAQVELRGQIPDKVRRQEN